MTNHRSPVAKLATGLGGPPVTEKHIFTLTDTIILLRYVEAYGQLRRGITLLKMRGSMHDHEIREGELAAQTDDDRDDE